MSKEAEIVVYGDTYAHTFGAALRDLREGITQYRYWHRFALNDLRARYRRSVLGEFWIGISLAIFVLSIGFFYGALLHLDPSTYLPYLLVGYAFWLLFSTLVVDGCHVFIINAALLKQRRTPLSALVLRNVDRAFMTLMHNIVVVAIGLTLLHVLPSLRLALLVPALVLWWLNAMWLTFTLGIACARFRDVPPAILSIIQLVFLISPVLWRPEDVPEAMQAIVTYNPLSHFLAIVRNPFLGTDVPMVSWAVTIITTLLGWTAAVVLLRFYRARVVYWV